MNNNIGRQIGSGLEKAGQKIAKLALRSAVILGAISGSVQDVQADTVQGVAMAIGSTGGGIQTERIDLDWNPSNPGAATLSSKVLINQSLLDQFEGEKIGFGHMTSGNNTIIHEPVKSWDGSMIGGLNIYYTDIVKTKAKIKSDIKFDGTNIKDATTDGSGAKFGVYDENNRFQLSEGAVPSEDQIIGVDESVLTYLIRTYQPIRDDKGHIIDMKLIAITDMSKDADFAKTSACTRVFKETMVALGTGDEKTVVILTKNADGTWSKKTAGNIKVNGWTENTLRPVFAGKDGGANAKLQSVDTLVVDEKLDTVEKVESDYVTTFDNGNYRFSYDAASCPKVKNVKTGETVSLAKNPDINTDMGFAQISDSPKTFLAIGAETFTIFKITSESPLKIETFTMPHAVAQPDWAGGKSYAPGHPVLFPMKDTNKDGISDFVQNAEAVVVQPGADAGSDTSGTPDAGSNPDTGDKPDAGSTEDTESNPGTDANGADAGGTGNDSGTESDTGDKPDAGSTEDTGSNPGTDANGADAGGTNVDSAQQGADGSKPQGGPDANNINGSEITSQPPAKPGTKPPEGCSTSPVGSGDPLRDSAPIGAALMAVLAARWVEEQKKKKDQPES